jgi:hypothetical protein
MDFEDHAEREEGRRMGHAAAGILVDLEPRRRRKRSAAPSGGGRAKCHCYSDPFEFLPDKTGGSERGRNVYSGPSDKRRSRNQRKCAGPPRRKRNNTFRLDLVSRSTGVDTISISTRETDRRTCIIALLLTATGVNM